VVNIDHLGTLDCVPRRAMTSFLIRESGGPNDWMAKSLWQGNV
jgi:hypothetical protein